MSGLVDLPRSTWLALVAIAIGACVRPASVEEAPGRATAPAPRVEDPLEAEVRRLIADAVEDHGHAPGCLTVRLGIYTQLVALGAHARPFAEDAARCSPIEDELGWALEQMTQVRDGCVCLTCLREQ